MQRARPSSPPSVPLDPGMRFTLRELVDEAMREADMRRRVYPRQVLAGRMTQGQAERNIAKMEAIARRLMDLARAS